MTAVHKDVGVLHLTGGAARQPGLAAFLEDELGLPVAYLPVPNTPQAAGRAGMAAASAAALSSVERGEDDPDGDDGHDGHDGHDGRDGDEREDVSDTARTTRVPVAPTESSTFALATAIALGAVRGGREIDLRRGPFVYSAGFSILRQKAPHLALLAAALLVAGGFDVFAALSNLNDEHKGLDARLKTATQELLGQPRTDAKEVTQLLRKGFKEELAPVPRATAYDLLDQISKKVPSDDEIVLDVTELDIRPKKTFIKGTVDSATAVDEIAEKLKEIDCYEDVTKGTVTEVSGDAKQFTLSVASKCP